jgi:hypothetical protein
MRWRRRRRVQPNYSPTADGSAKGQGRPIGVDVATAEVHAQGVLDLVKEGRYEHAASLARYLVRVLDGKR